MSDKEQDMKRIPDPSEADDWNWEWPEDAWQRSAGGPAIYRREGSTGTRIRNPRTNPSTSRRPSRSST